MDDTRCEKSQILNCAIGHDNFPLKCQKCDANYMLIQRQFNDYCFPIPQELGCRKANFIVGAFDTLELACNECKNKTIPNRLEKPINQCLFFEEIDNCEKYTESDDILKHDFRCLKCEDAYYINAMGFCELRKNSVYKCSKIDTN